MPEGEELELAFITSAPGKPEAQAPATVSAAEPGKLSAGARLDGVRFPGMGAIGADGPLPGGVTPAAAIAAVIAHRARTPNALVVLLSTTEFKQVFADYVWWLLLDAFRAEPGAQHELFGRIAANYVRLLNGVMRTGQPGLSERAYDGLATGLRNCLGDGALTALALGLPRDAHRLGDDPRFSRGVHAQLHTWTCGFTRVLPSPRRPIIASSATTMAAAAASVGRRVSDLGACRNRSPPLALHSPARAGPAAKRVAKALRDAHDGALTAGGSPVASAGRSSPARRVVAAVSAAAAMAKADAAASAVAMASAPAAAGDHAPRLPVDVSPLRLRTKEATLVTPSTLAARTPRPARTRLDTKSPSPMVAEWLALRSPRPPDSSAPAKVRHAHSPRAFGQQRSVPPPPPTHAQARKMGALTYREVVRASESRAREWACAYSEAQIATRGELRTIRAGARAELAALEAEKRRVLGAEARECANFLTSVYLVEEEGKKLAFT
ncbi:hypothetical protein KFE25_003860 [Diacronema lutheri]|uniref:Uncharacterized protein n=1 Tax=Diacronema lutheri TaxID=2081491 RepID=A0A8J5XGN5_DIALT|nr:hypothetical protein KFE25_003860 [Diacronema lutheri]